MVVDSNDEQGQDEGNLELISGNLRDISFSTDFSQISKELLAARNQVINDLNFNIRSMISPGKLIALMAIVPELRLVAWNQLLLVSPPVSVFFHVLSIPDMKALAQAEIYRLSNHVLGRC